MHDAALFQVETKFEKISKDNIKACFEEAMQKECPNVIPKALFKSFDGQIATV